MPVITLILIAVLNDGTIVSIAYDNVSSSKTPEQWNLKGIFLVSGVLGSVTCGASLLCLWFGELLISAAIRWLARATATC